MLVAAIALHLAVAQGSAAEAPPPPPPPPAAETAPLPDRPGEAAPLPDRASAPAAGPVEGAAGSTALPGDEEDTLKPTRQPPRPASARARQIPRSALNPIPSLLSAEPLRGRSAVVVWGGWSSLGAGWAQGVTPEDDLGVLGEIDWSTAELRLSAFYRRPLGRVGAVEIGSRLRAGWYADFGAKWFHDDNLGDRGIEFVPGLVFSTRGAGGVFSLAGDLPIAVTLWRDGGIFAAPKAALSYETLLYGDLTVGVRVAGAYRAGAGDAPMSDPRALLELNVLAGWRIF
jgi:hypothetical protein